MYTKAPSYTATFAKNQMKNYCDFTGLNIQQINFNDLIMLIVTYFSLVLNPSKIHFSFGDCRHRMHLV